MDTDNLIEKHNVPAEAKGTESGSSMETVKLVEMGPVSVETKGFFRGVEIGFTPRN
jgi:hypothetical protein